MARKREKYRPDAQGRVQVSSMVSTPLAHALSVHASLTEQKTATIHEAALSAYLRRYGAPAVCAILDPPEPPPPSLEDIDNG